MAPPASPSLATASGDIGFYVLYGLKRSMAFTINTYEEAACHTMAIASYHRMQDCYNVWAAFGRYRTRNFLPAEIDGYVEPEKLDTLFTAAPQATRAKIVEIRRIRPRPL